MNIKEELKKPEVAATVGAVSALVVATAVPAALLLTAGALTVGGVYLYHWKFGSRCEGKAVQPDCAPGAEASHDGNSEVK